MAKSERQVVHGLLTLYSKLYEIKFGKKPAMNRYQEAWGFKDILFDYSEQEVKDILQYFFTLNRSKYDLRTFFSNFSALIEGKQESERRRQERSKLLAQTKTLVEGEDV